MIEESQTQRPSGHADTDSTDTPDEAEGTKEGGLAARFARSTDGPEVIAASKVDDDDAMPPESISSPAKVLRVGSMIRQLLEEVRRAPLDDAGRERLADIYATSVSELSASLSPDLRAELQRVSLPFGEGTPSEGELRLAQAQLVGWLEGLFHGIQAAMFSQQVAQQQGGQPALPRGPQNGPPGAPGGTAPSPGGVYL